MEPKSLHHRIKDGLKNKVQKHLCHRNNHKIVWLFAHLNHHMIHVWELVVVIFATLSGLIFAGASSLPNNTSLEYPLQRVSTLECRTTAREEMTWSNCKINLPIIEDANYEKYENKKTYRDIYTTLWGASYNDSWNQYSGAHDWVDIASAKWTPLYSIWEGKIYYAGRQNGYGNVVKIEYIVDGEHVFAVYWHMDTMIVKKDDIVKKWQQIWTVWNSGNTFWALWWYHVHFEIAKDNAGRPMYAFLWCSDLNKWTYQIIMNGLCRTELVTHSYDPIEFIEKYIEVTKPNSRATSTWKNITEIVDKWNIEKPIVNEEKVAINDEKEDTKEIIKPVESDKSTDGNTNNIESWTWSNTWNLVELDFSKTSEALKHFASQRNLEITMSGWNNGIIWIWDKLILEINVSDKKDSSKFVWLLKYVIGFITTNKNIETDIVNLQLIKSSWTKITIEWKKAWKTTLIINLAWEKIWKLNIEVK